MFFSYVYFFFFCLLRSIYVHGFIGKSKCCDNSTRAQLYDLNGTDYDQENSISLYMEALDEFKRENPSFIGSKLIYAPAKPNQSNETYATYFKSVRRLHSKFPQFLAGFDLVGQEDRSPTLLTFAEQILQLPDDIKFFFHAGETNWFGNTDENLVIDRTVCSVCFFFKFHIYFVILLVFFCV